MTQVFLRVCDGILGRYIVGSCKIQESLELPVRKVEPREETQNPDDITWTT